MVELCEHRALLAEIDNFALKINSLHISAAKVSRKGILIQKIKCKSLQCTAFSIYLRFYNFVKVLVEH